jgi:hypothetical protein
MDNKSPLEIESETLCKRWFLDDDGDCEKETAFMSNGSVYAICRYKCILCNKWRMHFISMNGLVVIACRRDLEVPCRTCVV